MIRSFSILGAIVAICTIIFAVGAPDQFAKARQSVMQVVEAHAIASPHAAAAARIAAIPRTNGGEFSLRAKVNGVGAPMVVDTGATWVVLTYETAKAAGLPLEMLDYNVDLETANGPTKAARLTLDRLAVGGLVERSVPALVVPRGSMKTNLLGMSFLDRLESWEVSPDRLLMRGYP
ncbi:MAG: TIGR02281 family clan AA aspartic protease [Xanthobacteraceae bacterium]|nr:TIGR02281 family clan AA aspartic protease [Xanthobacteraceae bacterium]